MEKKTRRPGLLVRTAEFLDLPADEVAGLPRVELIGDRELRISSPVMARSSSPSPTIRRTKEPPLTWISSLP